MAKAKKQQAGQEGVAARVELVRPLVVVGLDPSTCDTGWGVIRVEPGERGQASFHYIDCGVLHAPSGRPLPERLKIIAAQLREVLARHRPDEAAVELAFYGRAVGNARTAIALGEARGMILCALAEHGLKTIVDLSPRMVKAAVTGNGAAQKESVAQLVKATLVGGERIVVTRFDPTDALGIALTHAILRDRPEAVGGRVKSLTRGRGRSSRLNELPAHLAARVVRRTR